MIYKFNFRNEVLFIYLNKKSWYDTMHTCVIGITWRVEEYLYFFISYSTNSVQWPWKSVIDAFFCTSHLRFILCHMDNTMQKGHTWDNKLQSLHYAPTLLHRVRWIGHSMDNEILYPSSIGNIFTLVSIVWPIL